MPQPQIGEVFETVSGPALVIATRPANNGLFSTPYQVVFQRTGEKRWLSQMGMPRRLVQAHAPRIVVFLNLADVDPVGLAAKTTEALRSKGLYVIQHDVFGLVANPNAGNRDEVRADCERANKVMLGIHGLPHDRDYGYGNSVGFGGQNLRIASCQQLSQLLLNILVAQRQWNLALIMCYGARSTSYRKDHEALLSAYDVTSSFAYKLFAALCTHIDVRMTARTGAVGFGSLGGGHSTVQTEAAVQAELAWTDLNDAPHTHQLAAFVERGVRPPVPFFGRAPNDDQMVNEYLELIQRTAELKDQAAGKQTKYGKFIYTYNRVTQTVRVDNKYAHTTLYEGPLVPWPMWKKALIVTTMAGLLVGSYYGKKYLDSLK